MKYFLAGLLLISGAAASGGNLSPDIRISSDVLGYDIQYRVYAPDDVEEGAELPVIFVSDGYWYIKALHMPQVLDRLLNTQEIEPVVAVFVDSRDPDNLRVNRRNEEFYCNVNYLKFFTDELIPAVEATYPVRQSREARAILGLSFGGLNAACFGLLGYETFSGIGMHSPATHPIQTLLPAYEKAPRLPLKIFLSTGWPDDNTAKNRAFAKILKEKNYDMEFVQVREGHNWRNWKPLIDDVLLFFYSADES